MNHLVIMAGGVGSRFWPMSTPECPKQFMDVLGTGKTLLQLTVERFADICPIGNIWVVTSVRYRELVKQQLPEIPNSNILLEPCMRNTAPCIAYVTWKIKKQDPDACLVVSPSDHIVLDVAEFRRVVDKGLKFVADKERILTLGMMPTRPETGYGYIQMKANTTVYQEEIHEVEAFKEKPDLTTAQSYLRSGDYLWNAGIFLWNVHTVEKAFRTYLPEMAALFDRLENLFFTIGEQEAIDRYFPECKSISIDYAIMEHARNIYVFPASFGWSDLGTWGSLYEHVAKDAAQNAVVGNEVKMIESSGCIVHVPTGRRMVLQGLENYIIAEENGVLLICRKSDEQRIKEFSQQ